LRPARIDELERAYAVGFRQAFGVLPRVRAPPFRALAVSSGSGGLPERSPVNWIRLLVIEISVPNTAKR
jgi:hypothetical protein